MNIFTKITAPFAVVALLVGGVTYTAIKTTSNIDHRYVELVDETIPVIQNLEDLRFAGLRIVSSVSEFGFIRAEREFAGLLTEDGAGEEEEERLIQSGAASYESALTRYEELVNKFFPEEKEFLEEIRKSGEALQEAASALIQSKKEGVSGQDILEQKEEFERLEKAFLSATNAAIAHEDEELSARKEAVSATTADGARNIMAVGVVMFLIAVAIGLSLSRHISKPITKLRDAADMVGKGNLDTRADITSSDEIGQLAFSFNTMAGRLQESQAGLEQQVADRTQELLGANQTLKEEIAQREQAEDKIKASLNEKEVLLKEINHRVKNNLQIISSLLNLQSRDIQDERTLRSFRVSQDRIRAMAMVHDKLYQSDDLARIDFGEYIKSLATDLGNSYGLASRDIDLKIDVENILLGVDTAIPCGVIVNELVANSLKHAFPGGRSGDIAISFREVDGQYTMIFKDDGVGLPEGLDISSPSSLGLTIVNALTGQLGGTIGLVNNGGTEISITFPAK